MSLQNLSSGVGPATAGRLKSRRRTSLRRLLGPAIGAVVALGTPAVAAAHGPVAPVATSYLAKIANVPAGLHAVIVDGYVRMWLRVPARDTLVVLDYRGAPYLRFTRAGVQVNRNSEMYYLNQTPSAWAVPSGLTRTTPPHWQPASAGNTYEWHDGRLQALASVAVAPGTSYVGRWTIPIDLNGRPTAISGGLWHTANPSIVWFWPLVVLFLCFWAAWRVRRRGCRPTRRGDPRCHGARRTVGGVPRTRTPWASRRVHLPDTSNSRWSSHSPRGNSNACCLHERAGLRPS